MITWHCIDRCSHSRAQWHYQLMHSHFALNCNANAFVFCTHALSVYTVLSCMHSGICCTLCLMHLLFCAGIAPLSINSSYLSKWNNTTTHFTNNNTVNFFLEYLLHQQEPQRIDFSFLSSELATSLPGVSTVVSRGRSFLFPSYMLK